MITYPTNYQVPFVLPYGTIIVSQPSQDDCYVITQGQVMCFGFTLGNAKAIKVIGQHVSFYHTQNYTIRMWAALEPNGRSITISPFSGNESVKLNAEGYIWNFYDINYPNYQICNANLNQWISNGQTYYFNVQNLENRENHFYLKFVYICNEDDLNKNQKNCNLDIDPCANFPL